MAIQLPPRKDDTSPRLLDHTGRPVGVPSSQAFGVFPQRLRDTNVGRTRGGAGFAVHGGYLSEKEKERTLTGRDRFRTYSQILADTTIVASGVRYFLNLTAKTPWKVRPANDTEEAKEKAEFVEQMIAEMKTPWHRVIRQGAMHRMYGFAAMEWTAEKMDDERGSIRISHIENRSQFTIEQWDTDFSGRVRGVIQCPQQNPSLRIYLPRNKLVYLCDNSFTDDPRGVGILRHVVRPVRQLRDYERLEHQGFETDMRGIPIARAPLSEIQAAVSSGLIEEEDAEAIRKPMSDFVTNHIRGSDTGLLIDSSVYAGRGEDETPIKAEKFGVELLSGGNYGHAEIAAAIERTNREIARVLGVEQLLLGADSAGSLALSRDKSQAFFMVVNAALAELKSAFQTDILAPLWILHGVDEELKPEIDFESVEFKDPDQISKVVKDLATSGVPIDPKDDLVTELLAEVGLSPLNQKLREEMMERRVTNAEVGLDENGLPLPGGGPFNQGQPAGGSNDPSKLSGNLPGVDPGGSADDDLRASQGRQAAASGQARPDKPA